MFLNNTYARDEKIESMFFVNSERGSYAVVRFCHANCLYIGCTKKEYLKALGHLETISGQGGYYG
jgi:coproporphyrinogen III oxidase-like Fe-S oxidoreductase